MIVVTGAAGFIGSALLSGLENAGYGELVAVDDFSNPEKLKNFTGRKIKFKIDREDFFWWLEEHAEAVQFIHHIGARTDTAEFDEGVLNHLNLDYSKKLWNFCCTYSIPFLYASSAATYGDGAQGFSDDSSRLQMLQPLNPYGWSKHRFDLWVREQLQSPPFWAGFKFFNVFGPNEYHKGRMASVVLHAFHQIQNTGMVKLFRSHKDGIKDGEQLRDFVYVKDVVQLLIWFMEQRKSPGLYNLGSGEARSFYALAGAVFAALGVKENIQYIDIPEDIRDKYQYYTCADMTKVRKAGFMEPFTTLEEAVGDYVKNYLTGHSYF